MINEKYVLGSMIQWQEVLINAIDRITENHFTSIDRILLFRTIKELYYKKVSVSISIINATNSDLSILSMECVDQAVSKQSFESHITLVEEAYINRKLRELLLVTINEIDNKECVLSHVQTKINELALLSVKDNEYSHGHSVMECFNTINEIRANKHRLIGMRTPWDNVNKTISNLRKGRTYIIGGLKKTGKSRFAIHLTSGLLKDGHSGVWFSMEMQPFAIHTCLLACRKDINTNDLQTGAIKERDQEPLMNETMKYVNEPLYISNKSSVSPAYISTVIKSRKHKGALDFVVIDYVQRMKGRVNSRSNRVEELENIMADLSDIARDENVAMIILSQLSGEAEKKTGNPVYSYFKGSQAILECADCAIVLTDANRGTAISELQDHKKIDAMIIQRDGQSDVEINFNAYLQFSKFIETKREKNDTENKKQEGGL